MTATTLKVMTFNQTKHKPIEVMLLYIKVWEVYQAAQ